MARLVTFVCRNPRSDPSKSEAAYRRLQALSTLHYNKAFKATSDTNRRKHMQASDRFSEQARSALYEASLRREPWFFDALPKARQAAILAQEGATGLPRRNPQKVFAASFKVLATKRTPAYTARKMIDADDLRDAWRQAESIARQGKIELLDVTLAYKLP